MELLSAIAHASRVLDWYENMGTDEMPPEWMWPFDDSLKIWFEGVDMERKNKYGGDSEPMEAPMVDNEYATEWRKGL